MITGYRSKSIRENGSAGPRVHALPVSVLAIWATSSPAERSDLSPPMGARGSAARFFLPTIDVLLRLCTQKHRTGWFQFLRTRLRHRVRGA